MINLLLMKKLYLIVTIGLLVFTSCKKKETELEVNRNRTPVAVAGSDQQVWLSAGVISLDGSGSYDTDLDSLRYSWTILSGPGSAVMTDGQTAFAQIKNIAAGNYQFELKVTDPDGASGVDLVSVNVTERIVTDTLPVINVDSFYAGNVFFYCPDPTGTMPAPDPSTGWISPWIYWTDLADNLLPFIVIKIDTLTGILAGIWSSDGRSPRCPVSSDYNTEPGNAASFKLAPGTYTWTAKHATDLSRFVLATPAFLNYFSTAHEVSGTLTVTRGEECIVIPIVF
jgi:hypothetical protein